MTETVKEHPSLTRRTFLKTTAVAAGTAALASSVGCSTVAPTESGENNGAVSIGQTFINECRSNCGAHCPLEATVREGKVVRTTPRIAPSDIRGTQLGCVKGQTNPQRLYAPYRVLYPMQQTGERGSENWERISWDEAITLVAEKFQAAFDTYGPSSVAFWQSFSSLGYLGGVQSSFTPTSLRTNSGYGVGFERFLLKTGATVFVPSSDMTYIYMMYYVLCAATAGIEDMQYAKTVINWGCNPADATRAVWPYICKAQEDGATVVTIDPQYTNTAAHSDLWLPIRPATDSALMLAMCNYIIDNDLIDYDYMKTKSVGPFLIKEDGTYLHLSDLGLDPLVGTDPVTGEPTESDTEVVCDEETKTFGSAQKIANPALIGTFDANGIPVRTVFDFVKEQIKPFTVDYAAEECDLPKEKIEELAQLYATNKPASITTQCGVEHFYNSVYIYRSMFLLASLTGNNQTQGASICQSQSSKISPIARLDMSDLVIPDAKPNTALTGEYVVDITATGQWAGKDFPLRCLYVTNANPLSNGLGRTAIKEAFDKIDFIVVADSFMTDTARYSDLILPIAMSWECEDHNGTFMMQKAVEPAGECKNDMFVYRALAEKLGFPELYDKTDEEYLRAYLDTPENIEAGCGYDDYKKNGFIEAYAYAENVGVEWNPTGRTLFYTENPIPRDSHGQKLEAKDRIPWYEPTIEAHWKNPLIEKYPLVGLSCHDNYQAHTAHTHVPWLDELRQPVIRIHETAAQERGIASGDVIRAFNDRGYLVAKALVTKGIRPDTILLPHGYQEDDFIDGHNQSLTLHALDPVCSNNNFNDILCQVELYEGGAQ